jgi:hypothetical protein
VVYSRVGVQKRALLKIQNIDHSGSNADPGCLSRISDPTFFHPGSELSPSRILIKEFKILTPKKAKKWFLSSKKYDPGCSSRIRMLTFSHPGSRIQGSKRHPIPDPGSRIRIRNTDGGRSVHYRIRGRISCNGFVSCNYEMITKVMVIIYVLRDSNQKLVLALS